MKRAAAVKERDEARAEIVKLWTERDQLTDQIAKLLEQSAKPPPEHKDWREELIRRFSAALDTHFEDPENPGTIVGVLRYVLAAMPPIPQPSAVPEGMVLVRGDHMEKLLESLHRDARNAEETIDLAFSMFPAAAPKQGGG